MPGREKIRAYVETVCTQIRWKRAHERVKSELFDHICDARDAYTAQGMSDAAATGRAIEETGDALELGLSLDRTHRPKPQWSMLALAAALPALGLLIRMFVFTDEDRFGLLPVRLFGAALAVAAMLAAYFADFTLVGKYPKCTYFGALGLMAAAVFARRYSRPRFR